MPASDYTVTVDPIWLHWIWTGSIDRGGLYGLKWRGRTPTAAHRYVWECEVGPIDLDKDGKPLELDHTCKVTLCVAPHHIEPVTRHENELRKSFAYRNRLTKCYRGHSLEDRITTPTAGFICRTCNKNAEGADHASQS